MIKILLRLFNNNKIERTALSRGCLEKRRTISRFKNEFNKKEYCLSKLISWFCMKKFLSVFRFFCWQTTSIIATDFYANRFQVLITICFDYKLISFSVRSMRSVYPYYSMGLKPIWRLLVVINTYDLLRLLNACYFVRVFRLHADQNARIFWNSLGNQFEINGFLSIIISINLLNGIHTNVFQSRIIQCVIYTSIQIFKAVWNPY